MNGRKAKALRKMASRVALEEKLDEAVVYEKFKKIFKTKKLKI